MRISNFYNLRRLLMNIGGKLFTLNKSGGNCPVFLGFGTLVLQRTDVTCKDVSELLLKIGNLENNAGFIDCVITSGALAMP